MEANASSATLLDYQVCTYSTYLSCSHTLFFSLSFSLFLIHSPEYRAKRINLGRRRFSCWRKLIVQRTFIIKLTSTILFAWFCLLITTIYSLWSYVYGTRCTKFTRIVPNLMARFKTTIIWSTDQRKRERRIVGKKKKEKRTIKFLTTACIRRTCEKVSLFFIIDKYLQNIFMYNNFPNNFPKNIVVAYNLLKWKISRCNSVARVVRCFNAP